MRQLMQDKLLQLDSSCYQRTRPESSMEMLNRSDPIPVLPLTFRASKSLAIRDH